MDQGERECLLLRDWDLVQNHINQLYMILLRRHPPGSAMIKGRGTLLYSPSAGNLRLQRPETIQPTTACLLFFAFCSSIQKLIGYDGIFCLVEQNLTLNNICSVWSAFPQPWKSSISEDMELPESTVPGV